VSYLSAACFGSLACVALMVLFLRREHRPRVLKAPRADPGEVVGLKVLVWSESYQCWKSPQWNTPWLNGCLTAHEIPTENNGSGIYIGKSLQSVSDYLRTPGGKLFWIGGRGFHVPHEDGYRVEFAYIKQEA
jgi:hypothetical protein